MRLGETHGSKVTSDGHGSIVGRAQRCLLGSLGLGTLAGHAERAGSVTVLARHDIEPKDAGLR
jgi:hypothetical protein